MKHMNLLLKYDLQFFAAADDGSGAGGGTDDDGDDGDDDQDDNDQDDKGSDNKSKKSDKKKYFTQEELDKAIKERLKRERKAQEKQQKQDKDGKKGDKDPDDKSKTDENAKKLSDLEMKVLCYDHDIAKEYVREAIALAKAYIDEDTDMDEALDLVVKKFPQFAKGFNSKKKGSDDDDSDDEDDTDNNRSWGQRQRGQSKKTDGVEAAFLRKNPGLKID